ncbi:DNA polymerase III subunit beta [Spongiactinospora sp. TRM90649]|uniref:DNA polymerase III subunit beta n=1 Tax=Spongiactinospora sp. TRM90649 TaxID=3031114 RepID=UPI0023F6ED8B|nr:DNA polymerase III subunit beta [Spongiactinospora sp. TRM90649]MDF5756612.1 DNA polymerase III subunit beta [Spongiactinospora sp. TRM90649]
MKLTVPTKGLADGIAFAARAIPKRSPVPVLSGIALRATGGRLAAEAYDYEISMRCEVQAHVADEGSVLVPGRVLAEICAKLPGDEVVISTDATMAELTCGRVAVRLPLMPLEDFPDLPETPPLLGTIESEAFTQALAQIAPATSKDDALPMLTGMLIDLEKDRMTLAATDRYRLARREITRPVWTPACDATGALLVPARRLREEVKRMPSGVLEIGHDPAAAGLVSVSVEAPIGQRILTSRLMEEQFIDYKAHFEKFGATATRWAAFEVRPVIDAVRRVGLVAGEKSPVRLSFTEETVMVSAGHHSEGAADELVDAQLEGEPITVTYQPDHLLVALQAAAAEKYRPGSARVRLGMAAPAKPTLLLGDVRTQEDEPAYRCIVMPLRMGDE